MAKLKTIVIFMIGIIFLLSVFIIISSNKKEEIIQKGYTQLSFEVGNYIEGGKYVVCYMGYVKGSDIKILFTLEPYTKYTPKGVIEAYINQEVNIFGLHFRIINIDDGILIIKRF